MLTKFTVYHDDRFWVGIVERETGDGYSAARIVFGEEPSESELYLFILKRFETLNFSRPSKSTNEPVKRVNPKRLIRMIQENLSTKGASTRSQEAIRQERELRKIERKSLSKQDREEETRRMFELKQQRKKQKKRGH
jgi:hypothetical protein